MTAPPSAVLLVHRRLVLPPITPLRRRPRTLRRRDCSKTRQIPRRRADEPGRKARACAYNAPSTPDNASKSAAVALAFFFQAEDGIRDLTVTGVQTCALPI